MRLTEAQLNHHVQIVGASGFGETELIKKILKHKISSGQGVVFIDLKNDRDTMDELVEAAKSANRESEV